MQGEGCRVQGGGRRVYGVGCRVQGVGCRVCPADDDSVCGPRPRAEDEAARHSFHRRIPLDQHVLPERDFFIDNLLVRIHLIVVMILVDRPCATGVGIPFSR